MHFVGAKLIFYPVGNAFSIQALYDLQLDGARVPGQKLYRTTPTL
jgi:hypothetical protein